MYIHIFVHILIYINDALQARHLHRASNTVCTPQSAPAPDGETQSYLLKMFEHFPSAIYILMGPLLLERLEKYRRYILTILCL